MRALLTARVLPEEMAVLKRAAELEREDGSLSRWIVELGLARAAELGIKRAAKLQESPPSED